MLVVFGSVAFDTIRTPTKVLKCEMGGAATYASISASFFTKTGLLAVIGKDFPKKYSNVLAKRMNLRGLSIKDGKTFRYDGKYDKTLENRTTLKTELNVLGDFKANVPDEYKKSKFVYLANNDPEQNRRVLGEFDKVKFSMCDTIDFWIHTKRAAVKKMIADVDAVVINDEEARLLTKEYNLVRCAKKMSQMGAKYVIIKKAEHGSLFFYEGTVFASPGFPISNPVDPTACWTLFCNHFFYIWQMPDHHLRMRSKNQSYHTLKTLPCQIRQVLFCFVQDHYLQDTQIWIFYIRLARLL